MERNQRPVPVSDLNGRKHVAQESTGRRIWVAARKPLAVLAKIGVWLTWFTSPAPGPSPSDAVDIGKRTQERLERKKAKAAKTKGAAPARRYR